MKWIYRLFRLFKCPHKYILYSKFLKTTTDEDGDEISRYTVYVLKCSRCGELKNHSLKAKS